MIGLLHKRNGTRTMNAQPNAYLLESKINYKKQKQLCYMVETMNINHEGQTEDKYKIKIWIETPRDIQIKQSPATSKILVCLASSFIFFILCIAYVQTVSFLKISIFRNIKYCSTLKINGCFGRKYHLQSQGRRISWTINSSEDGSKRYVSEGRSLRYRV
jgi:hypothetical protein